MILYKKKTVSVFKFILAFIIFILAMTITFDDVYGVNIPASNMNRYTEAHQHNNQSFGENQDVDAITINNDNQTGISTGTDNGTNPNPTSTPEPTTILLLAGGLGIVGIATRKKS